MAYHTTIITTDEGEVYRLSGVLTVRVRGRCTRVTRSARVHRARWSLGDFTDVETIEPDAPEIGSERWFWLGPQED